MPRRPDRLGQFAVAFTTLFLWCSCFDSAFATLSTNGTPLAREFLPFALSVAATAAKAKGQKRWESQIQPALGQQKGSQSWTAVGMRCHALLLSLVPVDRREEPAG